MVGGVEVVGGLGGSGEDFWCACVRGLGVEEAVRGGGAEKSVEGDCEISVATAFDRERAGG